MAAKSTKKTKKQPTKNVKAKVTKKPVGKTSLKKKSKPVGKAKSAVTKKAAPKKTKESKVKQTRKEEKVNKITAPKKITKVTKKAKAPEKKEELKITAPKPEVKKPVKGYSKKDLDHFRSIILEKRDEIIEQLQNLKEQMLDPTTGEYINENSPYSLHMAEQGTDAMEREKIFLYAQRENKFLGYLEDALKRIDAGTYGICIECIDEPQHLCETCPLVPKARLEAVPHSQLCLQIKQKQEKK